MSHVKKGLWVTFKPDSMSVEDLREKFTEAYPIFRDMASVEYKCWWVDEENGEWGAFYLFRSADELEAYLASERWQKIIPERYGCTPTWRVVDACMLLSKQIMTRPEDSWLSQDG